MVDYTIENVIVTTDLGSNLNLKKIANSIDNVDYNPEQFPGIVIRLNEPKTAIFILRNGKTVCIGGRNFKESRLALETATQRLKDSGATVETELDIDIQNIIVSLDLHNRIEPNEIGELFNWQQVTYDPEEFQGLIYQTEFKDVIILLFDCGKIICQGAKKLSEVNKVLEKFVNRLHSVGLI